MDDELTWDRSHDWVVHRSVLHRVDIYALVRETDLARQIMAVRKVSPGHREMAPANVRNAIVNGRLHIGEFASRESRPIIERAAVLGLKLEVIDVSAVVYMPRDRTANMVMLIDEYHGEMHPIVAEMIAAGVPVVERAEED